MRAKLTKRVADATRRGRRDVLVWDSDDAGFGLKVTPAGKRVFVYQYWSSELHGVRRRVTFGRFPSLTVDSERTLAKQLALLLWINVNFAKVRFVDKILVDRTLEYVKVSTCALKLCTMIRLHPIGTTVSA